MKFASVLPMLTLCVVSSVAMAQDKNCGDIANPQARQECFQHKYGKEVDCSKLTNLSARKECADYKHDNATAVDCSKLATEELRRQCVRQKTK